MFQKEWFKPSGKHQVQVFHFSFPLLFSAFTRATFKQSLNIVSTTVPRDCSLFSAMKVKSYACAGSNLRVNVHRWLHIFTPLIIVEERQKGAEISEL